jgi:hypothetical protein
MVIVSHRLSSLTDCDAILVLDQGRVVDLGPSRSDQFTAPTIAAAILSSLGVMGFYSVDRVVAVPGKVVAKTPTRGATSGNSIVPDQFREGLLVHAGDRLVGAGSHLRGRRRRFAGRAGRHLQARSIDCKPKPMAGPISGNAAAPRPVAGDDLPQARRRGPSWRATASGSTVLG